MDMDTREMEVMLCELVRQRAALHAHRDFIGKLTPEEQEELKDIVRKLNKDFEQEDVAAAEEEAFLKSIMAETSHYEDTYRQPDGC